MSCTANDAGRDDYLAEEELIQDSRSPEEVAGLFRVDVTTIYRWLKSGRLGALQLGKKWRIPNRDIVEFLQQEKGRQRAKESYSCPVCGRGPDCPWCGRPIDV